MQGGKLNFMWKLIVAILLFFVLFILLINVLHTDNFDINRMQTHPKVLQFSEAKDGSFEYYTKTYAYHLLTEECIPPYLLQNHTLGNVALLDVFVLSYRRKCDKGGMPEHVTHIFNTSSTWTTGRNILYYYVKEKGYKYRYHIYMDDDLELFFDETYDQFAKSVKIPRQTPGLAGRFLHPDVYQKAINEIREGKSAWRRLEEILLKNSPAYSVINHIQDYGFDSRVQQESRWPDLCKDNGPMPKVTPSFFVDAVLIAYHEEALPLLMPYNAVGDHISWCLSAVYFIYRTKAILYKQGITAWEISHINYKRRPYRNNAFPRNYLDLYWGTSEGKKIKGLVDVRDRDFIMFFGDGGKWRDVFFGDRGVCTQPIKFPVHKHYRTTDL